MTSSRSKLRSGRLNAAMIAPIILFLIGIAATIWLVTTPWFMRDGHAVEVAGQAAPARTTQIGDEANDE
jgi:hypothetical protein